MSQYVLGFFVSVLCFQGILSVKLQYLRPEDMLRHAEFVKANTTTGVFGMPLEMITL